MSRITFPTACGTKSQRSLSSMEDVTYFPPPRAVLRAAEMMNRVARAQGIELGMARKDAAMMDCGGWELDGHYVPEQGFDNMSYGGVRRRVHIETRYPRIRS